MPKKYTKEENPRRTANSVISLTQFAHSKSKGTRRAIERFNQKKQSKFNRNANLLRQYKKVMKDEGYQAGKGGSRKRNQTDAEGTGSNNKSDDYGDCTERSKKRHKSDPFAKAKQKARQSEVAEQNKKREFQDKMKQRSVKEKQKRLKAKKVMKRTKKGQPVMKSIIGDMLEKIKSNAADE